MGGHGDFHTVKLDPAVERWNYMREHTYHHFKMTRPIANKILAFGLVIPAGIFAIAQYTDERWNFAGARKNELTTQRGTFINTKPAEAEDDE
ncbi:hypothetical protein E3Q22_01851 [Wallemia mellicola]|uniref:Complex I-B15 n=2 Tax=Wallemia mellicola TaxID=1708541 RepID=A0A4T0NP35_9BASI|nr:hypothetical protein WALSEDRAFT_65001 [Wallemia mellicola CBS 633.66]TIB73785.1 hypothetical protein E3Q24_00926 [Wallemia mellicola]EIM20841.1 hypothetical protein WALSEDRAFT_65001 [Wallemia mellicola CBS 633.66]TIB77208.1 hypothetical protein E3Q23_01438 [Wallemia mellicola]TIB80553.1 hypothetical protein E3Q22_01851 [Wallemia mellicola]TIB86660.1 hypothetical protein E3Q21_01612 [Wallemia mellicola]|eukprot:XP_006959103.1 hypothetical protein WALSEDRAFT_65001 [Wallemia mellicola CBS 633.66]